MWSKVLLLLLALAACRPARVAEVADAEVSAPRLQLDAGWELTVGRLDAWLRYQQALRALPPLHADGGAVGNEVRARAREERRQRADAGLSEEELDRIEDLVAAVVAHRAIARISGADALQDFEKVAARLKDEQGAQAQQALAELRVRAQQSASLSEEKAKFGDENVRVVLTREAEVTRTWDALLNARGEKR